MIKEVQSKDFAMYIAILLEFKDYCRKTFFDLMQRISKLEKEVTELKCR